MSQASTLKGQCTAGSLDTGLLILLGVGRVAALKIAGTSFGQWEIGVTRGLGVAMAIYLVTGASGAHLNLAVTVALWLFACFDKRKVIPLIVPRITGAFCAAALVYGLYYNLLFDLEQTHHIVRGSVESVDPVGTLSTYSNPHINFVQTLAVEMVITVIPMGLTLAPTGDGNGMPCDPLAPLLIGLLTTVTGVSMGLLTGFAINPARDFGPKAFIWLTGWGNVVSTGGRDIPYFLVSLSGPVADAIVGVFAYRKLAGRHLSCDTCVVEKKETTAPSGQKVSL